MLHQQKQAHQYFELNASDWQNKATNQTYNVIDNRHDAVLAMIDKHHEVQQFLDVGCGTGQLVIELAKRGIASTGIDFSQEMINQCEQNKLAAQVSAEFICQSFFDVDLKNNYYDVISAQGFIEYISLEQLTFFFSRCHQALKKGGALVLGSRNRLFNLHSLNDFTKLEMALGTITNLLSEAVIFHMVSSQAEAFAQLKSCERIDPQPDYHPITGVKVDTRYQFSPADLIYRLRSTGFEPITIFPVHFHGFPVNCKKEGELAHVHEQLVKLVADNYIRYHQLIPYSSSFVMAVIKI